MACFENCIDMCMKDSTGEKMMVFLYVAQKRKLFLQCPIHYHDSLTMQIWHQATYANVGVNIIAFNYCSFL